MLNSLLPEKSHWGWFGQRWHDSVGIDTLVPLDIIISADHGLEINNYYKGTHISLEGSKGTRKKWSNKDLEDLFNTVEMKDLFNRSIEGIKGKLHLIMYRSIVYLEEFAEKYPEKLVLISETKNLKDYFDNKLIFQAILPKLGIKPIPGRQIMLDEKNGEHLADEYGYPFVIQFPVGSSGDKTFIIRDRLFFNRLCRSNSAKRVNVLKYIEGYSPNINALISSKGGTYTITCGYPSIQLVGCSECAGSETSYCGNDYTAVLDLDELVLQRIYSITGKVGAWMGGRGYRGLFGVDFMATPKGDVYPVEINPRLQNSTGLHTMMELRNNGGKALIAGHILEFLNVSEKLKIDYIDAFNREAEVSNYKGAQIIISNVGKDAYLKEPLRPGVYEIIDNELSFKKSGISIRDLTCKGEFLITSGVPETEKKIVSGASLCKIQTDESVLEADKRVLNKKYSNAVNKITGRLI